MDKYTYHLYPSSSVMRPFVLLLAAVLLPGCASVFSGYYVDVELRNAPPPLDVRTIDGVPIPSRVYSESVKPENLVTSREVYVTRFDSSRAVIRLRRNADHVLIVRSGDVERRVAVYRKLNPWWFILDLLCGGLPAFYDAYTGNWNYFSPVELAEQ
jgi:hypothetical protein